MLSGHAAVPAMRCGAQVIKYPSERRDVETLTMWVKTVAGSA